MQLAENQNIIIYIARTVRFQIKNIVEHNILKIQVVNFILAHTNLNFREHLPIAAKLIEIHA